MRNVHEVVEPRPREADPFLPRAARPLARADRRRLGGPPGGRDRRVDGRAGVLVGRARRRHLPHGTIAAYGGDTSRRRGPCGPLRRRAECDRAGGLRQRLGRRWCSRSRALEDRLWGVRLDTSARLSIGACSRTWSATAASSHRREPATGPTRARRARRGGTRAREDRRVRWLQREQDRAPSRARARRWTSTGGFLARARRERLHGRRGARRGPPGRQTRTPVSSEPRLVPVD